VLKPLSKGIGKPIKILRDWDRELQLFPLNEEFPVSVGHKLALITSLPFVHTARRCPGLSRFEKSGDCCCRGFRALASVETALIAVAWVNRSGS
jgi:hypothetical protein